MSSKKTELTEQKVKHITSLAKLVLSSTETSKFQKQLSEIFQYFKNLEALNTSKTEITSQVTNLENVTREDKINQDQAISQKEALGNTKEKHSNLFKVKAILLEE